MKPLTHRLQDCVFYRHVVNCLVASFCKRSHLIVLTFLLTRSARPCHRPKAFGEGQLAACSLLFVEKLLRWPCHMRVSISFLRWLQSQYCAHILAVLTNCQDPLQPTNILRGDDSQEKYPFVWIQFRIWVSDTFQGIYLLTSIVMTLWRADLCSLDFMSTSSFALWES